jgi:hypothetical protein
MKCLRVAVLVLGALVGQQASAQTTLAQWGVSALTSYADCSVLVFANFESCNLSNSSVVLGGGWTPISEQSGGLNETFAERLDVAQIRYAAFAFGDVDMGITSAQVQLDGDNVSVPILKAKAESYDDNGWVSATAFGIQGYQYTGIAPTTISLNAGLHGTIVNPVNSGIGPVDAISDVTGFSLGVWLLSPDASFVFPSAAATLGELVSAVLSSSTDIGHWTPADVNADGVVNMSQTITSTRLVQPNENFYLMAGLVASATGVRSADAFGTMTMNFDDAQNLLPAGVAPVPEPKTYAMFLVGLGLLGFVVRSRGARRPEA